MGGLVSLRGLTLRLARVGEERSWRQAAHGSVRSNGRSSRVNIVSRRGGITRHVGTIGLTHVWIRRLAMMRLQWRKRMGLRDWVLRLHLVLRHWHTREGSRALRHRRRRRSRRMRARIHNVGNGGCRVDDGKNRGGTRPRKLFSLFFFLSRPFNYPIRDVSSTT